MATSETITEQELKNAPLRKQWTKYGKVVRLVVLVNVAWYIMWLVLFVFLTAGLTRPFAVSGSIGVWASIISLFLPVLAIISYFTASSKTKSAQLTLIDGLINNSKIFDLADLSRESGLLLPDVNALMKEMIVTGTLKGIISGNIFNPADTDPAARQPAAVRTKKPAKRPAVRSKGSLKVFLSYATVDSDKYQIPLIAELLENKPGIEQVFYWQEHASGSIIEYMSKSVKAADTCIFFYSPTAATSGAVKKERDMAVYQGKHVIPVFTDINDVPEVLQTDAGVNASNKNTEQVVEELYRLISRR